jgi:hypothetical protein
MKSCFERNPLNIHHLDIKQFQSLIGALQWLVTLRRFYILIAVTTMSGYCIDPRQGHLELLKRVIGYVKRHSDGAIHFQTNIPDHESQCTPKKFDWSFSVCGNVQKDVPGDIPVPKGKVARTTTYQDAHLFHDLVTGHLMTGILHMLNQTSIHWFSKFQGRVKSASYGSEFMETCTATEQILDLWYTLRMMGPS